ncbi:MAG: 23S rRNA (guanosine(2251)-2'-O)-methyltransferase RlmB [Neomegalonema sp.]|nr:23S rRNA (guanosine(2251)-2'-O)-methyltransferase RlmB [Neomegalonema sp.]
MRKPDRRPTAASRRGSQDKARRDWRAGGEPTELWFFGLHAVRAALENPARVRHRLLATPNAVQRLGEAAIAAGGLEPEIQDPRRFGAPLDPNSVHQGVALHCDPLEWPPIEEVCGLRDRRDAPRVLLLDQVTDPHNVGAILRSAEVFGARAVIAPRRKAAPETGALAKSASGALERMPYLRLSSLGGAIEKLQEIGYAAIGLDGEAPLDLRTAAETTASTPAALALGAEGAGLRDSTKERCDALAKISAADAFASLNVSNAAAVALFALSPRS